MWKKAISPYKIETLEALNDAGNCKSKVGFVVGIVATNENKQ